MSRCRLRLRVFPAALAPARVLALGLVWGLGLVLQGGALWGAGPGVAAHVNEMIAAPSYKPKEKVSLVWSGGQVWTAPDWSQELFMPDIGAGKLMKASEVHLPKLGEVGYSMELRRGVVLLQIDGEPLKPPRGQPFRLKTLQGLMSTNGAKFFVNVLASGDEIFGVLDGSIQVLDPATNTAVAVPLGYAAVVRGQKAMPLRLLDAEERDLARQFPTPVAKHPLGLAKVKEFRTGNNGVTWESKDKRVELYQDRKFRLLRPSPAVKEFQMLLNFIPKYPNDYTSNQMELTHDGTMHFTWQRGATRTDAFCGLDLVRGSLDLDKAMGIQFMMRSTGLQSVNLDCNGTVNTSPEIVDADWKMYVVPFTAATGGKPSNMIDYNPEIPMNARRLAMHFFGNPTSGNEAVSMDVRDFAMLVRQ